MIRAALWSALDRLPDPRGEPTVVDDPDAYRKLVQMNKRVVLREEP